MPPDLLELIVAQVKPSIVLCGWKDPSVTEASELADPTLEMLPIVSARHTKLIAQRPAKFLRRKGVTRRLIEREPGSDARFVPEPLLAARPYFELPPKLEARGVGL
jgi:hypothetical protein